MRVLYLGLLLFAPVLSNSWGFYAHKRINRLAVFTLPPEMMGFYKQHIQFLTERAVNPDKRRYVVKGESPRHYIDLDVYGDSAVAEMPRYWNDAVEKYTEDTLLAYGVVPYHVNRMAYQLIKAFEEKNAEKIVRTSSDLGHYIADANVPLHTTRNYNGQLTGQTGIHGLWESRLPELFADDYDLLTGQASYVENLQLEIWKGVILAHMALDTVLRMEKEVSARFSPSKKYGYEERGLQTVRVYSYEFSKAYHQRLNGMVERRMRASIKMVGDFWFSCWVKAGQPDLTSLNPIPLHEKDTVREGNVVGVRPHEKGN